MIFFAVILFDKARISPSIETLAQDPKKHVSGRSGARCGVSFSFSILFWENDVLMASPVPSHRISPSPISALMQNTLNSQVHKSLEGENTHVVFPSDLVGPGIGLDAALEVAVVALLDVGGVQAGPEEERRARNI